jgi:hypothetical protein
MSADHLLRGLISAGPAFPDSLEKLIAELAMKLGLPRAEVGYSVDSLGKVEGTIRSKFPPDLRDDPGLLLPLVAYATEVARREAGGRWEMRLAEHGLTWEPWVVDPEGHAFEVFTVVYKQMCDLTDESASLVGALLGTVRSAHLDEMADAAVQPPYAAWRNDAPRT